MSKKHSKIVFSSHPGHGDAHATAAEARRDLRLDSTKAEGTPAEEALDRRIGG